MAILELLKNLGLVLEHGMASHLEFSLEFVLVIAQNTRHCHAPRCLDPVVI